MSVFPSEWAQKRLRQSDNDEWIEDKCYGFPLFLRAVKQNDGVSHNKPTGECEVTFFMTALAQGDEVVIEPQEFTVKINQAIMRGVQHLLLNMVEGEKVEAILPKELAFGADSDKGDIYVEIELRKLCYYTGIQFVKQF